MKHIGIVACSAEGAALCYRTICIEAEKLMGERYAHPEVSMHTFPFNEYVKRIEADDWSGVAELMVASAKKLASIGADFAICPDNTIHRAFDLVIKESPIPWLHIAEEVAKEAVRRGFKHLGILGTRFLMESDVYPDKLKALGIKYEIPVPEDRARVNEVIFNELVYGVIRQGSRKYLCEVIEKFKEMGCDAVVLGCTELPLIVAEEYSPLPILDSTRILARAAIREAVGLK
ncbi:MAG: aspartate racemase [Candidatus Methanomethylicota archaeon]|uniref:Aspartate racemase n=1 Tax=Thermoproteota archaeon TaxID=2056631 RepID=A0A497EIX5_9CREN|nr:MAG: aspartate racemase [Candidatus Verstraetearchaeota archaeon]